MAQSHELDELQIISTALRGVKDEVMQHYPSKNTDELQSGAFGDRQYEVDLIAERSLISSIRNHLPNHNIVSEESGIIRSGSGSNTVLMDPLDGSLNAIRGIPFFSSTLAIARGPHFSDITAAGVIDLLHGDIYLSDAYRSTLNGASIRPSPDRELGAAIVSIDIKIRKPGSENIFDRIKDLWRTVRSSRVLGSAALETAYVSSGKIDAFLAPTEQLRTFDCLPSIFIARASGAFVKTIDLDLPSLDLYGREGISYIVASTQRLGTSILSLLNL